MGSHPSRKEGLFPWEKQGGQGLSWAGVGWLAQVLAGEVDPPLIELIGHLKLYKLGILQLKPRLPPQATINAWLPSPGIELHSSE